MPMKPGKPPLSAREQKFSSGLQVACSHTRGWNCISISIFIYIYISISYDKSVIDHYKCDDDGDGDDDDDDDMGLPR